MAINCITYKIEVTRTSFFIKKLTWDIHQIFDWIRSIMFPTNFIFALRSKTVKSKCSSQAQHWHNSFSFAYPTHLTQQFHQKPPWLRAQGRADQAALKHTLSSWDNTLYNNQSWDDTTDIYSLKELASAGLQKYSLYFWECSPQAAVWTRWHQQAIWKLVYTRSCDFSGVWILHKCWQ